jgi:hypothetical protein
MAKRFGVICAVTGLLVTLTGCTPTRDAFMDALDSSAIESSGFTLAAEPAVSCGSSLFGCSQPLYEYPYTAPADLSPAQACDTLLDFAFKAGKPIGYGPEGQSTGPVPADRSKVAKFCEESIGIEQESADASFKYYEGFFMYDDGARDQVGKNYILRRDEAGKYTLIVAFSRDLPRISWTMTEETPTHNFEVKN